MFNETVAGLTPPTRLSFDHDPLFEFLQWKANLSILGIDPVTTVPVGGEFQFASFCAGLHLP